MSKDNVIDQKIDNIVKADPIVVKDDKTHIDGHMADLRTDAGAATMTGGVVGAMAGAVEAVKYPGKIVKDLTSEVTIDPKKEQAATNADLRPDAGTMIMEGAADVIALTVKEVGNLQVVEDIRTAQPKVVKDDKMHVPGAGQADLRYDAGTAAMTEGVVGALQGTVEGVKAPGKIVKDLTSEVTIDPKKQQAASHADLRQDAGIAAMEKAVDVVVDGVKAVGKLFAQKK